MTERCRRPPECLTRNLVLATLVLLAACSPASRPADPSTPRPGPDLERIVAFARALAADSLRGRGPYTVENERAARMIARELERLGARPLFGESLLVPFTTEARPGHMVYNVAGVLPSRGRNVSGELVGITAHLDHLGVGVPDATGDSIYNGFLDAALPVAMVLDVAARYAREPGERPLAVMYFNLEEQGLLGSRALAARPDATALLERLRLLIGVDAGSPAGEAIEWQLMGAIPSHSGARIADSLARERGWTTTATPARRISDVFVFAERGVPIVFPIPGATWRFYTREQREAAMREFDHYHQPADEWRADYPLVGTEAFADWLWEVVRLATRGEAGI